MRKHWTVISNQSQALNRGKFLINGAYKLLRGPVVNVPWRGIVCLNVACPKQTFILWLALLGRMRTKDVLINWGMEVKSNCVLCGNHPETQQHLFFECDYSLNIWSSILGWLGWQRQMLPWALEWQWVLHYSRSKTARCVLLKACFVAAVYEIWCERNSRIFQNTHTVKEGLIHIIKTNMCIRVRENKKLFDVVCSL